MTNTAIEKAASELVKDAFRHDSGQVVFGQYCRVVLQQVDDAAYQRGYSAGVASVKQPEPVGLEEAIKEIYKASSFPDPERRYPCGYKHPEYYELKSIFMAYGAGLQLGGEIGGNDD